MAIQAKISDRTKKTIREITKETGETQIEIIEHAVINYHREWQMRKVNEAYFRLREDEKSWSEELKEREVWDQTAGDGLEDE
jgi:predicted transcriptional regulator